MKPERLDKVLSNMGVGSRSELKKIVRDGLVSVNGVVVFNPALHVDPVSDVIKVADETVAYRKFIYLMMHKPEGFVSSTDEPGKRTVVDLIPEAYAHFAPFPVGRLDIDSTGLLLLTNDGELAHRLLSPKRHIEKEYIVTLDKQPDDSVADSFLRGVVIDGGVCCKPAQLRLTDDPFVVHVVLTEGKYHQIKRMFAASGIRVLALKRIRMGALPLDETLATGCVRELTAEEITLLTPAACD